MRDSTKHILIAATLLVLTALGASFFLDSRAEVQPDPGLPALIDEGRATPTPSTEPLHRDARVSVDHGVPDRDEQPAEAGEPDSVPWFRDMSDVPMTGLKMREYLAVWHPEIWPLIEASTIEDSFFDFEFESEVELGDPLPCLRRMPDLLMASFDSQPGGEFGLYRNLKALPGVVVSKFSSSGASMLRLITTGPTLFNPNAREIAQSGPQWDQGVEWLDEELKALREYAKQLVDDTRAAVRSDLEGLSPTRSPRYGKIMFGPFYTRDHPEYHTRQSLRPYVVSIWAGDTINDCKKFTASYILALEEHPALTDSVREMRIYRDDLFNRVKAVVDGLP